MLRPGPRDNTQIFTTLIWGNASPKPRDKTQTFEALTWGQGEALANIHFRYDSNIVAANASPLQQSSKSQISCLFLFVEFLGKRDRVGCKGGSRLAGKREWKFLICCRMF